MKNIRLTLEYDGTNYASWQWQPDEPTLQGALEMVVRMIQVRRQPPTRQSQHPR